MVKDVSGKRVQTKYGVVHYKGKEISWIDGPYEKRKHAEEVKKANDSEVVSDSDANKDYRFKVVPMTYLVPHSLVEINFEIYRWAQHAKEILAKIKNS